MKKFLALAAFVFLAACQEAPPSTQFAPISIPGSQFRLNVAEIRVEDNTQVAANDVSSHFPVTPNAAVQQWVRDHFVAAGSTGYMVVMINDGSAKEVKLQKSDGLKALFRDEQDARYDTHIGATFRLYTGASALSDAEVNIDVAHSRTINEKATLVEREQFYYDLTHDLMQQFNAQAEPRVRQYFAPFLR
jgi:hypothetical protein